MTKAEKIAKKAEYMKAYNAKKKSGKAKVDQLKKQTNPGVPTTSLGMLQLVDKMITKLKSRRAEIDEELKVLGEGIKGYQASLVNSNEVPVATAKENKK